MLKKKYALLSALALCICSWMSYAQTAVSITSNADSQVSSANSGLNYGTVNSANVSVVSSTDYYRTFFGFSFSGIPSTAVIVSATLSLTPIGTETSTGTTSLIAQGITGSWTETGIKFAAMPAVTSANQQTTSALSGGKRTFDVTAMVQAHFSGTPITGIMVRRNSETTVATPCKYNTREATTSTDRPVLLVSWYDPIVVSAATIFQTTAMGTSDGGVTVSVSGGTSSAGAGTTTYKWYNTSGLISGATTGSISGKPAGCYGLTVSSTYGPSYSTMFLVGTRCEMVTMNLLKDQVFVDDAKVYKQSPSTNYGSADDLFSGNATVIAADSYLFYLRNRIWYDPQYSFYSATQNLIGKGHSTQTNAANLYRATADWDEALINFTNRPSVNTTTPAGVLSSATSSTTESKALTVTDFYNYWNSNPGTAFGYSLNSTVAGGTIGYQDFYSSDATTVSNRPYLTVVLDDATCDRQSYYSFKRDLDASLVSTVKYKLSVQFTEEYQQELSKKWAMQLYDYDRNLKAAINYDGTAVSGKPLLPAVNYVFGDNRAVLDLSSYSLTDGAYYILELTKSTGEKEYIEFIYKN